ncbi:MAG: tetratricopeptide repeat protein [Nostocales cyanobacterium 94392]|nr:tetratricopeptide repeat protein [Nostocales cyanobacterium 94392]
MKNDLETISVIVELIKLNQFDLTKVVLVQKSLNENPDNYKTIKNLSLSLINLNKFNQAFLIHQELKKFNEDDDEVTYNLALLSAHLKDHEKAIIYFDQIIKKNKEDFGALINKSASLIDLGKLNYANQILDKVIAVNDKIEEAWINKAIILSKLEQYDSAICTYDKILKLNPNNYDTWLNRSLALKKNAQLGEALESCDKALSLKPDYAEAWLNRSYTLNELKRYAEALESCDKALSLKPDYAEAWSNRSYTLNELKRYAEALESCDKALSLKPDYAEAWSNRSYTLNKLKRYAEALESCDKALSLKPDYAEAWYNRGVSLYEIGNFELANESFDKAISHKKNYAEAWYNKGVICSKERRYREAIDFYKNAINIKSDFIDAILNQGLCFGEIKEYEKSISCYRKVISLNQNSAEAWNNSGVILSDLKNYDRALKSFELAYKLKPNLEFLLGQLVHIKMIMCDWSNLDEKIRLLECDIGNGNKVIAPFPALAIFDSPQLLEKVARIYVEEKFIEKTKVVFNTNIKKDRKIKVGYYSADFGDHPISYLIPELLELHNRNHFEIYGFSFGNHKDSPFLKRIKNAFDHFYDLNFENDQYIVKLSRRLEIDIAIDLMGHTKDSRMAIFSSRVAPIQISYLGYLGTSGANYIDYIIADKTIIPNESVKFYSEKPIFLPSYQANDKKKLIADRKFSKRALGLPDNAFMFCCLNNTYKILPTIFDSWMRILKARENSVLYLYAENKWAVENLRLEAKQRGVDESRIIFAEAIPYCEYLARYKICDLFLDTSPYNAGTTASDALWAGLPILTLKGQSFSSRMASSLLSSIGIPELITNSLIEYEAMAIELSGDSFKLTQIKEKLIHNIIREPLFDSLSFVRNYEKALSIAYQRGFDGLGPDCIDLT